MRRVFEGFAATGSATKLVPLLHEGGVLTKTGRPFDKGSIYKLLNNRTYLGEVAHKQGWRALSVVSARSAPTP